MARYYSGMTATIAGTDAAVLLHPVDCDGCPHVA